MRKFCLVDDSVSGIGGTMLTLSALTEDYLDDIDFISTYDFSLRDVFRKDRFFIFGNITHFSKNSLDAIIHCMENFAFIKIEFDYGYCSSRGRIPHQILQNEKCNCPNNHLRDLYSLIASKATHIFYMSEAQKSIHSLDLDLEDSSRQSVLSSCFSKENLLTFKKLKDKKKNDNYAIIDGNGGWHTQAKGIKQSIEYAEANNLKYDLIKTKTHSEMLEKLSSYKGLISMPIIEDTCPRITLEARYMGLEVLTNENSQHISEDWWKSSDKEAFSFTASRPNYFWEEMKCLS